MKFSYYDSVRSSKGKLCDYYAFLMMTQSPKVESICAKIAAEPDHEKQGEMKKQLPIICWQAYFEGKRLAKEAQPSGLFMLDIDGVEDPWELWKKVASQREQLGIVIAHKTPSCKGLRLVARCKKTLHTLEECQKWMASNLKVEYDAVCKDFARSSFIVPYSYFYYIDGRLWEEEPEEGTVYAVDAKSEEPKKEPKEEKTQEVEDQREGLFGGPDEYKGVPLAKIAKEWLEVTGGMPEKGERNARLYKLALRLRYLTDFNAATMLRVMPDCGLPEDERKQLIHSALSTTRAADMPKDMQDVLRNIEKRIALTEGEDEVPDIITATEKLPPLPPVIRQFVECAPDDFKQAVALCQLPILGALGSRIRATYLDGKVHSPSFLVSLEAPQASGKSFMTKLVEYELAQMLEHDEAQREKEREYDNKIKEMKLLNIKVTAENKDSVLGSRPKTMVRYVPATMSITKLLMRMDAAQGCHLFAVAPEIDTVTKAFKRGFSSFSDLLRVSFDNDRYGQDYASENSFSGIIPIYYNMLTSGTPKAMRRFYPDVEDGLVSRVCFVTLPDQFGKRMPEWKELSKEQQQIVDVGLVRLNDITIQADEVQPEHMMKLDWLNKELQRWLLQQQAEAVKQEDRTRDIFCRRAAVVGFRAGMLAYFLYNEKNTPTIRKNVMRFAVWVANCMLNQHMLRFNITKTGSNLNQWEEVYKELKKEFTSDELQNKLTAKGYETPVKMVLYKWKLAGCIKELRPSKQINGQKLAAKYTKIS